MTDALNKAVFLSYASQDADAARRICEALRTAGVEVWFDQSELRGGDSWDAKIRKQIKECGLFVPIISANTDARAEGYFRLEWLLAVERARLMADDHPFLFPIAIADVDEATARVPARFRDVQWTRLRLDETPAEVALRIGRLLGDGASDRTEGDAGSGVRTARTRGRSIHRWWWMILPLIGIAAGFALLPRWKAFGPATSGGTGAARPAAVSEAPQLVAKAHAVFEEGDLVNRETYVLAEALLKKAEELDVTDAEAWALHATLSARMLGFGFDSSTERRDAFRAQAERAIKLAPQAKSAQLAYAEMLLRLGHNPADAELILERLNQRYPDDWRVLRVMARWDRRDGQLADALSLLQRARRLSNDHPSVTGDLLTVLFAERQFTEAESVIEQSLAKGGSGRIFEFDVRTKLSWRGDSQAAAAAMERWPSWMFAEDRGAQCAALVWMFARQPTKALAVVSRFPRDYFRHNRFTGPRGALSAWLHELAGNAQAAATDWRAALQVADRELTAAPDNVAAMHWKAWALARLGDRPAAEKIFQEITQRSDGLMIANESTAGLVGLALVLGKTEWALAELEQGFQAKSAPTWATRAVLELNPCFDSLRKEPRFQALVAAAPAPQPTKAPSAGVAAPDPKSVAVLPFANLSGDPAQDYFSDGVTEEIRDALARERDLRVVPRTSAFSFKEKNMSVPEIARALNVAQVVEGTVRRAGGVVRITATLTRVSDGFVDPLPAITRELKDGGDLFAIQESVARAVVEKLTGRTSTLPVAVLTNNPAAYDAYLRGREMAAHTSELWMKARDAFQGAVALDPLFAVAWAHLAITEAQIFMRTWEPGTLERANRAIEQSLRLQADLAEAHLARAYVGRALFAPLAEIDQHLERAERGLPNNAELLALRSFMASSRGDRPAAITLLQRAAHLDPLNGRIHNILANTLSGAGQYAEAEFAFRAASRLLPESVIPLLNRAAIYLAWKGDVALVRKTLDEATEEQRDSRYWEARAQMLMTGGEWKEAETALARLPSDTAVQRRLVLLFRARLAEASGDQKKSRALYTELVPLLEKEPSLGGSRRKASADDAQDELALVYAALGKKEEAFAAVKNALATIPEGYRAEAARSDGPLVALAQIHARFGEVDQALTIVREQVAGGFWRRNFLLLNPGWSQLRKDPRFMVLVKEAPF